MMNTFFAVLSLAYVSNSLAFQMKPQRATPSKAFDKFGETVIDLDKAQDCAEHFGKYSVQEIEEVRDQLHAHRLQNMALAEPGVDIFQEQFLEEELTMQLDLLQKDMPESYLFPEQDVSDPKDVSFSAPLQASTTSNNDEKAPKMKLLDKLTEEGVTESLAICAMIGFLMMTPQVF
jgi:hypothetical protein